jgi:hypothetical protein
MASIHAPLPEVYDRVARMEFLSRVDQVLRRLQVLDAKLLVIETALGERGPQSTSIGGSVPGR